MLDYEYMFEYSDDDGDEYSSELYTSLADCRSDMKCLTLMGNTITRTFKYVKGDYVGSF